MDDDKTRKRCVGTPVPGCPQIPSYREAHLHFLHQKHPLKRKNRKHIFTDFSERMCFLALFLRKVGFELFKPQSRGFPLLLQRLLNSNSHGDGHTDHGVVARAQEAHHFHVKSAWRRLCACGAGTFWAGSPTFRKTRSTSHESSMLCFPFLGVSYHINCSRNKMFWLNYTTFIIIISSVSSFNIFQSSATKSKRK